MSSQSFSTITTRFTPIETTYLHPQFVKSRVSTPRTRLFSFITGELIEHLAHLTIRIQRINGIPQNADSLRMSFGEVDKKGTRNITAYVIRGARQTRVEWIAIKQGQNVVEAFGKKVGGFTNEVEE